MEVRSFRGKKYICAAVRIRLLPRNERISIQNQSMEEVFKRDLTAFKGLSLASYRSRTCFQKWSWTFILPAILLFPFRAKDKKTISIVVAAALSAVLPLATIHS
jgi:hypothetical protein